mgnify:CR=1 FL=1
MMSKNKWTSANPKEFKIVRLMKCSGKSCKKNKCAKH